MKLKSKTTKKANGKYDITIAFTTQQLLAIWTKKESEYIDKIDYNG